MRIESDEAVSPLKVPAARPEPDIDVGAGESTACGIERRACYASFRACCSRDGARIHSHSVERVEIRFGSRAKYRCAGRSHRHVGHRARKRVEISGNCRSDGAAHSVIPFFRGARLELRWGDRIGCAHRTRCGDLHCFEGGDITREREVRNELGFIRLALHSSSRGLEPRGTHIDEIITGSLLESRAVVPARIGGRLLREPVRPAGDHDRGDNSVRRIIGDPALDDFRPVLRCSNFAG